LVNSNIGLGETDILASDEIVLAPGEGIAVYQESAPGDTNLKYRLTLAWKEVDAPFVPSLTFSISDNTTGFGILSSSGSRYATGDTVGSGSDSASAHTISASTNASDGYTITVNGTTLTCTACGGATVSAIGGTAVAASVGTEQYGLRGTVVSGVGTVSSPYNGANWALDTAAFPDTFATGAGDDTITEFGVRYISNVSANTESGQYNSVINFVATASF
jgi:hypothetical protein